MTTTMDRKSITITYEPWNFDRLYSPDGRHHLLLCEDCKQPEWVEPNVDSVVCEACYNARQRDEEYEQRENER